MTAGRIFVTAVGVSRPLDPALRPLDPALRPLPFAASDARAFAEAARRLGASPSTTRLLSDGDATVGAVRDALDSLAQAGPDDSVYVFAVAHATLSDGAAALLAADGEPVPLAASLRPVWDGPARRVVVLLDLNRGAADSPVAADLVAVLPPRPGRGLALADDGSHGSHVSGERQAGVWAAAVTAAFAGDVPRAREADGTLTVRSLRAFVADEVPRSLVRAYSDGRTQSPVLAAASEGDVLADPPPAAESDAPPKPPLAGVRFFSEREVPVKRLGGFRKSLHSPPSDTLNSSREWVARLAEPDLAKQVEETAGRLRKHLGYKRRDVRADGPAGGAASVLTPDFAIHLTARQHADRPDRAVFRRSLEEVRNAEALLRPGVAEAFPDGFAALWCPFETPADIAALVDAIEDAEPAAVRRLDYPTDLSRAELELAGFDGVVRIEPAGLTVHAAGPQPPAELARLFGLVRQILRAVGA